MTTAGGTVQGWFIVQPGVCIFPGCTMRDVVHSHQGAPAQTFTLQTVPMMPWTEYERQHQELKASVDELRAELRNLAERLPAPVCGVVSGPYRCVTPKPCPVHGGMAPPSPRGDT